MMIEIKCDVCSNQQEHKILIQIGSKRICNTCVTDMREAMELGPVNINKPRKHPEYFESRNTVKPVYVFTGFKSIVPPTNFTPITA